MTKKFSHFLNQILSSALLPNQAKYWLVVQQGICQEAVRRCEMPRCLPSINVRTKVETQGVVRDGDDGHYDGDEDHGDDVNNFMMKICQDAPSVIQLSIS